jgi:hypothetical protein
MKRMWLRAAMVCCALMLASCGGGGGGDSGSQVNVSSDRSTVDFAGFSGESTTQSVNFTLLNGSGTYYGSVVADRPSDFSATFTPTSNTTATVTLTRLGFAAAGQGSGNFVFRLCTDAACSSVAWSQTIPYSYTIFAIDRATLAFSGFEGLAAGTRALTITPADTGNRLAIRSNETGAWLSATRTSASSITVVATAASLAAGRYLGTVQVRFAGSGNAPTLNIPVDFTVGSGLVAPPAGQIDLAAEAATLAGTVDVAFNGDLGRAWTASSDQPWLVVDTPSGSGTGTLQYHADVTRMDGIPNWGSATANVTIRAAGLTDVVIPVTLNKRLPEVYATSPAAVVAGRPATVRVIGRGLSQLSGVGRIRVTGAAAGITGTVLSDREAVLSIPAVAAGRATVSVANAAGVPAWSGTLGAAALAALPASAVPNAGNKRSALFDPPRNALYAINFTQNTLVRFRYASGQWQTDGLPVVSIGDLAMSPDRQTLYVGSGTSSLLAVDPDTLQVKDTYTVPAQTGASLAPQTFFTRGMAVTNNLRLWFGGSQWSSMAYFDMRSGSFGTHPLADAGPHTLLYSPEFFAPGDGSTLFVLNPPMLSPRLPSYVYTTVAGSLRSPSALPEPYRDVTYDETGSRMLVDDDTLYDASSFSLIGTARITSAIGTDAVLSPDGTRLYRLVTAGTDSLVVDHVNVYDTTQVEPGTSALLKLGQIAVATQGLDCGSPTSSCDVRGAFVISPLGDTLFWLGNRGLVVVPIPSELSGVLSTSLRVLKAASR